MMSLEQHARKEMSPLTEAERLFKRALDALAAGQVPAALALLERALKEQDNPSWHSYLGYCIAKERGQLKKGRDLCLASMQLEPATPAHYLNLARIHLIGKQKADALRVLRQGMSASGGSPEILSLLAQLGVRKPPVLSFLPRDHYLNKWLGLLLSRLHLR